MIRIIISHGTGSPPVILQSGEISKHDLVLVPIFSKIGAGLKLVCHLLFSFSSYLLRMGPESNVQERIYTEASPSPNAHEWIRTSNAVYSSSTKRVANVPFRSPPRSEQCYGYRIYTPIASPLQNDYPRQRVGYTDHYARRNKNRQHA